MADEEDPKPQHTPGHHGNRWYHRHPEVQRPQPTIMATKSPSMKKVLTTEKLVFNVLVSVFALVFTFVGLFEVFPFYINIAVYIFGIVLILAAVWRWEKATEWSPYKRSGVCFLSGLLYCGVLAFPVVKQYQRENNINVTFKVSPQFTFWRKQVIRHDLTNASQYLKDLGIPVPSDLPPLGIQTGQNAGGCGSVTPPGLPLYRSEIVIGESQIKNRKAVTLCYISYVVDPMLYRNLSGSITETDMVRMSSVSGEVFSSYLNSSFWGTAKLNASDQSDALWGPFGYLFWSLREKLGQDFADRLATATLKAAADDPYEGNETDMGLYFASKVKIGESVIDNECSQWPEIEKRILSISVGGTPIDRGKLQHQNLTNVSSACIEMWRGTR